MDVKVLELLASRICHDLISPAGAVNNGIEFMEEMGPDSAEEAMSLIKFSAHQSTAKLQAFRYAYGAGGADPNIKPEDIQRAFSSLISGDGKITQSWDPYAPLGQNGNPPGFCKLLMAALMLSQEFLPKGGNIRVIAGAAGETKVIAESDTCTVRPGIEEALLGKIRTQDLDPKLVHPYVSGVMAEKYGFALSLNVKIGESIETQILCKPNL